MKTVIKLIIILTLTFSASKAYATLGDSATSNTFTFPKIPSSFVGFDFSGYAYPSQDNGMPYTKVLILKKTAFLDSPTAFYVASTSQTAAQISSAMDLSMLQIGILDDENNEFFVNAYVLDNTNSKGSTTIYTDDLPGGISEGLATIVTLLDSNEIEKDKVFITKNVATRDSINPSLEATYDKIIPLSNFKKKSISTYIIGENLAGKKLLDGAAVVARSKIGLTKGVLFPSSIYKSRNTVIYEGNEIGLTRGIIKDKTATGSGLVVLVSLWGIDLLEMSIPECTTACGTDP